MNNTIIVPEIKKDIVDHATNLKNAAQHICDMISIRPNLTEQDISISFGRIDDYVFKLKNDIWRNTFKSLVDQ